ncbi:unnamed protein product [marine sediment metagenome]|uniref:Uncharacterized protein n=1 Tax=marine sediment metagenome TaxID=412755 RepID=X1DPA6_9ZZZZ
MGLKPVKVKIEQRGKENRFVEDVHYLSIQRQGVNVMIDVEPLTLVLAEDQKTRVQRYGSERTGVVLFVS